MKSKTFAIRVAAAVVGIMVMAGICAGQSYWKRTYEGSLSDAANAITPTLDGNFIVAGATGSFGNGNRDVYLLKIKPDGDTLWTKTYGCTGNDQAFAIAPASDSNFIVAGGTYPMNANGTWSYQLYLLKIKSDGDTVWTKTFEGMGYGTAAYAIAPASDGNFIVAGVTGPKISAWNSCGVYLLKIKPDGDTLWTKIYQNPAPEVSNKVSAIAPTLDGNFLILGEIRDFSIQKAYFYLLNIKPDGDTLWSKKYGPGDYSSQANAITPTSDGNFIIAGKTNNGVYVLKIKPDGDTIWTKTYGGIGEDWPTAITPTPDGNFIVAGYTYATLNNIILLKINSSGDTLWTKMYGEGLAYAITATSDGNLIVAGFTQSVGTGNYGIFLLSIIDDRYAKKDSLFTFKIPVSDDSLNHGYTPLKVPAGMTVSLGGTISWTPTTDSSYMDHVEFLVSDDMGKKDTLTFNIFVNSKDHPNKVINPTSGLKNQARQSGISISTFSSYTSFTFTVPTGSLAIYDIHGRLIQNLSITNNAAVWRGKTPAGRYFAKLTDGKRDVVMPFMVVR